jgi:hypothetical protein
MRNETISGFGRAGGSLLQDQAQREKMLAEKLQSAVQAECPPPPPPEITQKIGELGYSIDYLDSATCRLADRLAPVLRPADGGKDACSAPCSTQLGGAIQGAIDRVNAIQYRIGMILETVEL